MLIHCISGGICIFITGQRPKYGARAYFAQAAIGEFKEIKGATQW